MKEKQIDKASFMKLGLGPKIPSKKITKKKKAQKKKFLNIWELKPEREVQTGKIGASLIVGKFKKRPTDLGFKSMSVVSAMGSPR